MTTLDLEPIKERLDDLQQPDDHPIRAPFEVADLAALVAEVEQLRGQIDAVKALHRPAHAVFSWSGGTIYEDPCPQCHGAPGVHPCGCWADTQLEYVCAECHRLG